MALDWNPGESKFQVYETYKDLFKISDSQQHRFEHIASSASNQNIVLYSADSHHMVHIVRDRYRVTDKVYEDWIDFDLHDKLPIKDKKILAVYLTEERGNSIKAVLLFEGGLLASFKLPFREVKSARINQTSSNSTRSNLNATTTKPKETG
jgi:hypothetical protein